MTSPSLEMTDAMPSPNARTIPTTQRLFWSLRRELWENRVIWIAPAIFACVALVGFFVALPALPQHVASLTGPDPAIAEGRIQKPFIFAALAIFAAIFLVAVFYCLEALQGERRDRSILFWKSMPLSDRTTVLSKALTPLVVMPLVAYATCSILHVIMLVTSCAFLIARGGDVSAFIAHLRFMDLNISALYLAIVLALWHAPVYSWLLFLSSWAGRAAVAWAFGPIVALWVAAAAAGNGAPALFEERMKELVGGWGDDAIVWPRNVGSTSFVEPALGNLLHTPHLWFGLVFTTLCVAAAVHVRKHRESN